MNVVRPRVLSPLSGEKLYLDDALEPLIKDGRAGAVCVSGPPASGKSTALSWLASRLPSGSITTILDDPRPDAVAEYKDTMLVVYSASTPFGFPHRAAFALAPWGEDEILEYLLEFPKEARASVLDRLRRSSEEDRPSWPEVWRACLDVMVGDPELETPRDALRRGLDRILPAEARARARRICLERGIRGTPEESQLWSNPEFLSSLAKKEISEGAIRFLRYGAVRIALAAEQIVEDLEERNGSVEMWQRPERNIVREVARVCANRPAILARLKEVAKGGEGTPMPASLLVAAEPGWRPSEAVGWYLKGAILEGARWEGLNLKDARLEGVLLGRATLRGAVLNGARAEASDLRDADLTGASLSLVRFLGAQLGGARLTRAFGGEASFSESVLRGADLSEAKIPGALFAHADLTAAVFRDADLRDAVFQGARLEGADFRGADLRAADLSELDLRRVNLDGARLERARLSGSDLEDTVLHEADLNGAALVEACLTGSRWPRADLRGARLVHASLANIRWEGADLRDADMRMASFHLGTSRSGLVFGEPSQGTRTGFYEDPVRDRPWRPAEEIRVADLRGADLRGADLEGTDFYRVDLRGARLDVEQRDQATANGAILE